MGAWAYPGTANILLDIPCYLRNGESLKYGEYLRILGEFEHAV